MMQHTYMHICCLIYHILFSMQSIHIYIYILTYPGQTQKLQIISNVFA